MGSPVKVGDDSRANAASILASATVPVAIEDPLRFVQLAPSDVAIRLDDELAAA